MPCQSCHTYSAPRGMNPVEQWISFSRHHTALELETEKLRLVAAAQEKVLKQIKAMFPSINFGPLAPIPPQTPPWKGETYRDAKGKWPSDIRAHLDWLSEEDFK